MTKMPSHMVAMSIPQISHFKMSQPKKSIEIFNLIILYNRDAILKKKGFDQIMIYNIK